MNWRALLQNQWFQLCLLVTALSGGVMIYNIAQEPGPDIVRGNGTPAPGSSPSASVSRRTITKIAAKKRGQWILDSSGARDADSGDIETVAASLSDGDVVNLRAGTYTGNFEVNVSAHFIGPASGKGVATIRGVDGQRAGLTISGKKVEFENISLSFESAGDSPAVQISREAAVELTNCAMTTQSKFGILVSESASLTAQGTQFRAANAGCCLKYQGTARGTLSHCSFLAGRWGMEVVNAAQVQGSNCSFQQIGLVNGVGLTLGVVGGRASLTLDACQFDGNTAAIMADEGGTLHLTGSTLRNNGITGEGENTSWGMICAQHGSRVSLKDDVFEDNRQGLVALGGSSLLLERAQMRRTGLVTENQKLKAYCNAVGASDQGTTVNVMGCTIFDSLNDAFNVAGGANLNIVETTITNSNLCALTLGFANTAAAQAVLNNVRINGAHGDAIFVNSGSQLDMQSCQVANSDFVGVEAQGNGSQGKITNSTITGCKSIGLDANLGATITAFGCTMEATTRGAQAGLPNDQQKQGSVLLTNCTVRGNSVFGVGACRGAMLVMKGGFLGGNKQNTWHESGGTVRVEH
ncbi:MAG TPA: right-handed parallel beta-helix repeat-containing protein [Candidatus Udaeobacter sp.]|nr:right-handed parallel beta-helix repeat-containing protein [Candidatus Udaeobacter sp.]